MLAEKVKNSYEEIAEDIVFIVSFISRELYPVEKLCAEVFTDYDAVPRITESGYCKFLYGYEFLDREGGQTYKKTEEFSHIREYEDLKKNYAEKEKITDSWVKAIEEKTIPALYLGFMGSYITSLNVSGDFYRDTIVNDRFWEIYQEAVEELTVSPEKYVYDEEKTASRIEEWERFAEANKETSELHRNEMVTAIYADSEKDIRIRAYCYAACVIGYETMQEAYPGSPMEEVSLNDFVVLLLDWEHGQRSFIVYKDGSDSGEFGFGYDCFVDLTYSREYIQRWGAQ